MSSVRFAPLFWLALAIPVVFFLGQTFAPGAALYTRELAPVTISWISTLPKLLFCLLAVLGGSAVVRRFEAGNPSRRAWQLWTAGIADLFLGQATLTYFLATRGTLSVFPSVADLFFVLGCLSLVAALFAFLRSYRESGFPIGTASERWGIALGAIALGAAVIVPVLWPLLRAPAPPLEKLLNLAYPTLDLLMLVPALVLLRISLRFWGGKVWTVWAALIAGILCTTAGDLAFAWFSLLGQTRLEALIDVAFLLGYGFFAATALSQRELLSS